MLGLSVGLGIGTGSVVGGGGGAPAMTWSPTDNAFTALSGGNLTATFSNTLSGVRTSRGIGAGNKVYVELTGATNDIIAVADSAAPFSSRWGSTTDGLTQTTDAGSWYGPNGALDYNTTRIAAGIAWVNTDVLGIALDTTVSPPVVYFSKNGTFIGGGNPVAGTGGLSLTSIASPIFFAAEGASSKVITLNPGTTPGGTAGFSSIPTGYVAP